ncbi:MAG TPA: transketolase [Acidimicrobiales bacterium]|jgi:transketolase|nr:transketolase [Acidimicrobiales bacterium]MDP6241408.1 transketolase [Acidimicrobiales bacterium]MDP7125572.1 transketolase [Acidimicrobiales bacterium]MDP7508378.1 transketolase [Acidimicrobiales bacterium]HJL77222.1 transketolase [Acidimicrobiales bacterium]|tara:strand:+ start:2397 stop:4394 length:1998 start_codon:yes stop_codon:yes gene_type:complete
MSAPLDAPLETHAVNVIRGLSMDGPHAARSGHQGTAMALAPLAHVLWTRVLTYDAGDPGWPDRDRFILSAGHASILLYSMLHLTGHGLTLEDLRRFRQWESATPGHPEVGHTAGVEVTTGPLGQGLANAVGMAVAERNLRSRFGSEVCNHHTFVVCGDGDLAEGISHEAASLAGHLGLGRLIAVYDDNHITIDGPTELALSDDAPARFGAYGWHVVELGEAAEDLDAIEAALRSGTAEDDRPTLIVLRSHIATPSPDVDTSAAHGYSLTDDGIAETKRRMGLPEHESFHIPDEVLATYREAGARGSAAREAWQQRLDGWDGDRSAWEACWAASGLDGWTDALPTWEPGQSVATRKAGNACLTALLDEVPGLIGGGADLTGNTGTTIEGHGVQSAVCPEGRQLFFGVREHAMGAICNGMALHGGLIPVGGTFLVFSDYMRGAVRLAALSGAKTLFVWTHDSVGVGEDGPTHQPVEHAAALRAIPGLRVFRPADANETAGAWRVAIEGDGPTAFLLTRQDVPVLAGTDDHAAVARGAYVLVDADGPPDIVLIGTGSEVAVALDAAATLSAGGTSVRVVSMPSMDLFGGQDGAYRSSVLPPGVPVVSVEAGVTFGWGAWADSSVGIDRFGASAPGAEVMERLGITPTAVVEAARALLDGGLDTKEGAA